MSKIEVNAIEPQCGTTLTVGASGDTITFPTGTTIVNNGTQTGFGRTGTVDWITTPKTTGTFTAVSGEGYFLNTSGGVITANLPAGVAGAIVSFADYAATWQTSNVTVVPNGTDKIGSVNENAILNVEGQSVTFVFVDSTQGWINTMDSTSNVRGAPPYIAATGGTILTCGNFKTHVFTGPGTFTVTTAAVCAADNAVEYLVVAGGGSGARYIAGGGGAGGVRTFTTLTPANPINAPAGVTVSATAYPITVGAGGLAAGPASCAGPSPSTEVPGEAGTVSTFSTITSAGGGGGGKCSTSGLPGGSGGGGGGRGSVSGGTGNTPPTSPPQGNTGGGNPDSPTDGGGGGGGGATTVGGIRCSSTFHFGGAGGTGAFLNDSFFGPTAPSYGQAPAPLAPNGRYFGGGGGAGGWDTPISGTLNNEGVGGGGYGTTNTPGGPSPSNIAAGAGVINTGGGGGSAGISAGYGNQPGAGGSGIVVIRYKFQ